MPGHLQNPEVAEELQNVLVYVHQCVRERLNPFVNAKFDRQLGERLRMLLPTDLVAPGLSECEDVWHHLRIDLVSTLMHGIVSDIRNAVPVVSAGPRCNVLERLLSCVTAARASGKEYSGSTLASVVRFVVHLFLSLLDVAEGRIQSSTERDRKMALVATAVIQLGRQRACCVDEESFRERVEALIARAEAEPNHVAAFLEDTISNLLKCR